MMQLDLSRPTAQPRYRHLRLFFMLALAGYTAVLCFFSLTPSAPSTANHADKVLHFIAYGGLTALMGLAWPRRRMSVLFLLASAVGLSLECAQGYLPIGRTMSMADQTANMGGAVLAILTWTAIAALLKQPKPAREPS